MDRQWKGQVTTQAGSNESRRTKGDMQHQGGKATKGEISTYKGQATTAKGNTKDRHRRDRPQPLADSNGADAQGDRQHQGKATYSSVPRKLPFELHSRE